MTGDDVYPDWPTWPALYTMYNGLTNPWCWRTCDGDFVTSDHPPLHPVVCEVGRDCPTHDWGGHDG